MWYIMFTAVLKENCDAKSCKSHISSDKSINWKEKISRSRDTRDY